MGGFLPPDYAAFGGGETNRPEVSEPLRSPIGRGERPLPGLNVTSMPSLSSGCAGLGRGEGPGPVRTVRDRPTAEILQMEWVATGVWCPGESCVLERRVRGGPAGSGREISASKIDQA